MRTTEKETLQAGLSREAFIEPIPLDRQPPIKRRYIWNMPPEEWPTGVTEQDVKENPDTGQKAVAPHFHTILRCELSRDEIESCWHRKGVRLGRVNTDRLQMDKNSLEALANYMLKYPKRKHRYFRSRGIKNPITPPPADGKWTRRQVQKICTDGRLYDPEFWAKKYPGWDLNEASASYNEFMGWHISLKLRRRGPCRGNRH